MPDAAAAETTTQQAPPTEPVPPSGPTLADVQKQLEQLTASLREKDEAVKFWYDKAQNAAVKPAEKAKQEDPPDEDFLAELATKGPKAIDAYLAKKGFIRHEDAEHLINTKAGIITRKSALLTDYPELKDEETAFFKSASKTYKDLIARGYSEIEALETAALRTDRDRLKDTRKKDDEETDRKARASAATGETSRGKRQAEPDDDELSEEQKRVCDGMGVSYDDYKKIAKRGVTVAPRR